MTDLTKRVKALEKRFAQREKSSRMVNDPMDANTRFIGALRDTYNARWISYGDNYNRASTAGQYPRMAVSGTTYGYMNNSRHNYFSTVSGSGYLKNSSSWNGLFAQQFNPSDKDNINPGLTVGLWSYISTYTSTNSRFSPFAAYDDTTSDFAWMFYSNLTHTPADAYKFNVQSGTVWNGATAAQSDTKVPTSTWHFMVGRWEPGVNVYLDQFWGGEHKVSVSGSNTTTTIDPGNYCYVGAYNGTVGLEHFSGIIGHTFVIKSYLSDAEVNHLYQMSRHVWRV